MHAEERQNLQHEMIAARARVAEDQIGRLASQLSALDNRLRDQEHWIQQAAPWLTHQAAALEAVEARQTTALQTGDRVRYAIAAAMVLLAVLAGLAPEQVGKLSRILALVP